MQQTIKLSNGQQITFYLLRDVVMAQFPHVKGISVVGAIVTVGKRYAWAISETNYWAGYSTVCKRPICVSSEQAFAQLVAFAAGGTHNNLGDNNDQH